MRRPEGGLGENIYRCGIVFNTTTADYLNGIYGDNEKMDISTIRLRNLDYVIGHYFQGKKAHLAEAMGVSPNNISRYYSANASHRRAISDEAARSIERAVGLTRGWMDVLHASTGEEEPSGTLLPADGSDASRFEIIKTLTQELEGLTDSEVAEVSAQLKLQLELIRRRHGAA